MAPEKNGPGKNGPGENGPGRNDSGNYGTKQQVEKNGPVWASCVPVITLHTLPYTLTTFGLKLLL